MTDFRTKVKLPEFEIRIDHWTSVLCVGSCFAEHIYRKLTDHKFSAFLNQFGILYNPAVISDALDMLSYEKPIPDIELFFYQELWHSFAHHGHFSHPDKEQALLAIKSKLEAGRDFLTETTTLIITLGTAHVYVFKKTGKIVANCHKIPAASFSRRMLTVDEIVKSLGASFEKMKREQPQLDIILAVSPVRHLRDGLVTNQRSKATLVLAAAALCSNHDYVHYFPSYEIVLDELRDYRFYEEDMAHPNKIAVDYIWSAFSEAFFTPPTRALAKRIGNITQAARHKPFHPPTQAHQHFIRQQLLQIEALEKEYRFINFDEEIANFKKYLIE